MKAPTMAQIRAAVADYVATEGCSCCSDYEGHKAAAERLGKLIGVRRYSDRSGRDFLRYREKKGRR